MSAGTGSCFVCGYQGYDRDLHIARVSDMLRDPRYTKRKTVLMWLVNHRLELAGEG